MSPSTILTLLTNITRNTRFTLTTNYSTMSATKKTRTHPPYELLYWPSIPGRGEFIRLAFEASGVSYKDTSNESKDGINAVLACKADDLTIDSDGNPPAFAPPALRVPGEGKNGKALVLYQTPSILAYLGDKLGLAGEDEAEKHWILSHALTVLDLNNEVHDTHHPIAVGKYYEDQKEEALKKATDVRENRIPKFLGYFERILKGNEQGKGKYLVGGKLSYADTTLWHVLNGLKFAFPKEMEAREKEFTLIFETFYPSVQEENGLKEYLVSDRRQPYSMGIFRHYPELDRQ
ncbi:glutathione S-transferase protein-like protein [Pleomassaria siparia CBS 279.74]|uniref:Glutathione S-transferase protein-like protein n=1 Tax=Pleomassaria siparia CBS 279.74 TaxID=1314801 RepID=A0A6G1KF16_9PLEO|nr:glutathione S-transferase protein-like protein [Pleomassaria siparia CBS 279.74]